MFFRAIRVLAATAFISHLLMDLVYAESGILDVIAVTSDCVKGHFHKSTHMRRSYGSQASLGKEGRLRNQMKTREIVSEAALPLRAQGRPRLVFGWEVTHVARIDSIIAHSLDRLLHRARVLCGPITRRGCCGTRSLNPA